MLQRIYSAQFSSQSLINFELFKFKTLCSRRQYLSALFLFNVFKNKTNFCSVKHTAAPHVPTKQIRDFSTSNVSNVSRQPFNKARHGCKQQLKISGYFQ
jgi:hypothetical protein